MNEAVTEPIAQELEASQIRGVDAGPGLHFHRGHAAIHGLEDRVDLGAATIAEVEERRLRLRPPELLLELVDDERLEERTGCGRAPRVGARDVDAEQEGCEPGVRDMQLGVVGA